jgi:hypothetical protein
VGKHAAADGSSVDPLIADALTHRPPDPVSAPRHGAQRSATGEGAVGWPGEPPADDAGVGWPEPVRNVADAQESDDLTDVARQDDEPPAEDPPPSPPAPRRRWRRLLAFSA